MKNLSLILNYFVKNKEIIIVSLISLTLISIITALRISSPNNKMGDTALMYSTLEFINKYNFPYIPFGPTLGKYLNGDSVVTQSMDFFKNHNFNYTAYISDEHNVIKFHTYLIAYLMAPFAKIFSSPLVVNWFNSLSFIGVLSFAYYYLRSNRVSILISTLSIFAISLNHAWSHALFHQPYFDRLYLVLSFLMIIFTIKHKLSVFYFLIFFSLSSCVAEKYLIFNFLFLITYSVLYWHDLTREKLFCFVVAAIFSLLTFFIATKYYLNNFYYEAMIPKSISNFIASISNILSSEALRNKTLCFFIEVSPLLFLQLFFARKFFIISLVMLLPNIFFTIGGAEKTGFYSHYHSGYLSYLFLGFVMALSNLYNSEFKSKKILIYLYTSLTIVFYLFFSVNSLNKFEFRFNTNSYLNDFSNFYKTRGQILEVENFIQYNIPENANLSVGEIFMPYVYRYEKVSFFPYNYENADFLLVNYSKINGKNVPYFGTFLGEEHNFESNLIIYGRLKQFFDFDNPLFLNDSMLIVAKLNF